MNQKERLDYLINYLLAENNLSPVSTDAAPERTEKDKLTEFQRLCNIRPPAPVTDEFIQIQNEFLTELNHERPLTSLNELTPVQPQLYVWQGDITSLKVDAIVNAANSDFIGCTQANHHCIDNKIHTRSGVQLRLDCASIIQRQGRKEPVGKAKLTNAYNLPSDYVIHTVGPFIDERGVSPLKEKLLASSYRACLAQADKHQLSTIAFCCISTGEFNFPNQHAAAIAIETVRKYLTSTHSQLQVIFNVFKDEDLSIYQSQLELE